MIPDMLSVIVSYRAPHWLRVAIRSFWNHFPDQPILVVDNNPPPGDTLFEEVFTEETTWLQSLPNLTVLRHSGPRSHGAALDFAMQYCREHSYKKMLTFEPDCLIRNRAWLEEMLEAMESQQAWLVGRYKRHHNPIHPCPTLWEVSKRWYSFDLCGVLEDSRHPQYYELVRHAEAEAWERRDWDTGFKNWFIAATNDKAVCLEPSEGFKHFWQRSARPEVPPPITVDPILLLDPELNVYLPELVQTRTVASRTAEQLLESTLPVVVSYRASFWLRIALCSFWTSFPGKKVLVVDNNPLRHEPQHEPVLDKERRWLLNNPDVIPVLNTSTKDHGVGLDLAMQYCLQNGYERMLVFEPDCLISGSKWLYEMLEAMELCQAWLVGRHQKLYGPIHPCPSIWEVSDRWHTFDIAEKGSDPEHLKYWILYNLQKVYEVNQSLGLDTEESRIWWRDHWDVGQKNWFLAACNDRAICLPESPEFQHYWGRSVDVHNSSPMALDQTIMTDPKLRRFVIGSDFAE